MSEPQTPLSNYVRERREQILALALGVARRRRRNRQSIKAAILVLVIMPMVIVVISRGLRKTEPPIAHVPSIPAIPKGEVLSQVIVVRISDDPGIVRRLTVPPSSNHVQRIGDQQLLSELAAAHEPAGLAYVNGKAELIYR